MKLRTAVTAGLMISALTITAFAAFSANAQNRLAPVQVAQADTANPAARLEKALLALKEAQKAFRAAKESGKGVKAAQEKFRLARDEVKAARQAALAAGTAADTPGLKEGRQAEKAAEEAPAAPAAPAEAAAGEPRAAPAGAGKRQRPAPPAAPAQTAAEQAPAAQPSTAAVPPPPVASGNPQARLQAAILAERNAQAAFRAARASGKGVQAARARLLQAREELAAAQQAVASVAPTQAPAPARQMAPPAQTERRQAPPAPAQTAAEQAPAAQPRTTAVPPPPVASGDPQARLQAAIIAEQDARKAFRAAKKSGKGLEIARAQLRAAREELNAAQQAVAELTQQQTPVASEQTAPAVSGTETARAAEPQVKTGIVGETVDPQVLELRRKLRQARQRARQAEQSAAEAQAKAGGGEVVRRESDRVIIKLGDQVIIRSQDENERFLRDANDVAVVQLPGGLTRTTVTRPNGVQIITITNRYGEIIYRVRRLPNGQEIVLIDNRQEARPVVNFDIRLPRLTVPIPRQDYIVDLQRASEADLRTALRAPPVERVERIYSLEEVRRSERLRDKVRRIDLDKVTFDSGSAAISRSQVRALTQIGEALEDIIYEDPDEIFLVEGHTDAVGSALYNLALSDRRAESVAIILSESFDIPPENLITQGYGEDYLKIPTLADERRNRRVTIRRITPLIRADVR